MEATQSSSSAGRRTSWQMAFEAIQDYPEEKELIYLAAFFDAEGNVAILHTKPTKAHPYEQYALTVSVVQKEPGILDSYKVFGGSVYYNKRGNGSYQ